MRRKRFLGRHSLLDIRWNEVEVPDAVMRMTRMSIEDDDPVAQISGAARLWREPHPDTCAGLAAPGARLRWRRSVTCLGRDLSVTPSPGASVTTIHDMDMTRHGMSRPEYCPHAARSATQGDIALSDENGQIPL